METYVLKERWGIWAACLMMAACFAAAFCLRFAGFGAIAFVSVAGTLIAMVILNEGAQTKVFSREGLCVKRPFGATSVRWDQVDRIGVIWMRLGSANPRWYISITWNPQHNRRTWVQHWLWWMKLDNKPGFLFPRTDELQEAIVKFYGPLDFDGRNDGNAATG